MPIPNPTSQTVRDVLETNGGFYIPNFQREFAWGTENAEDLMNDIHQTVEAALLDSDHFHELFLGTAIFYDSRSSEGQGMKRDDHRLSFPIYDIIDGQQRITTFILLSAVLEDVVRHVKLELEELSPIDPVMTQVANKLEAVAEDLQSLQALIVPNRAADPARKPKLIRAHDESSHPPRDQWTLCNQPAMFYTSDIAKFLQRRIEGDKAGDILRSFPPNLALKIVGEQISENLGRRIGELGEDKAFRIQRFFASGSGRLLRALQPETGSFTLTNFPEDETKVIKALYLLAFAEVFLDHTQLIVIKCDNIELAFDMFQSINAAGVPLTVLEVFKPDLVLKFGERYGTQVQKYFESAITSISKTIPKNARNKPDLKFKSTAEIVQNLARSFDGSIDKNKFFGVLRSYLKSHVDQRDEEHTKLFIKALASESEFYRLSKNLKHKTFFDFRTEIVRIGSGESVFDQASEITLCVMILKDLGHQYALALISVFYFRVRNAEDSKKNSCVNDLHEICRVCLSFYVLWKGLGSARFPDGVYKALFADEVNVTHFKGAQNQTVDFVKERFLLALKDLSRELGAIEFNRELWVHNLCKLPVYKNPRLAKFLLYLSHHNALPNFEPGHEGELVNGGPNSNKILTCEQWVADLTIEHVCPKTRKESVQYPEHWDDQIYEEPNNVHLLGNLTLLRAGENSSVSDGEWPEKLFFYWSLTNCGARAPIREDELKRALRISTVPPSLPALSAGVTYVEHLAPLIQYGLSGGKWDLNFIKTRTEHLAGRCFDELNKRLL